MHLYWGEAVLAVPAALVGSVVGRRLGSTDIGLSHAVGLSGLAATLSVAMLYLVVFVLDGSLYVLFGESMWLVANASAIGAVAGALSVAF